MPMTALGRSDLRVSRLALGSWRTYERISRDQGVRVMRAAREAGINFLDDARYNDETGHAPLPTGYSEVVFGELFRASAWRRDEVVVSNKLWWEFWPDQSPGQELAGSLARMGLDRSLAMAFALLDPSVTTVLFGATRPEQVSANLGALALAERLTPDERDRLAAIGVGSGP